MADEKNKSTSSNRSGSSSTSPTGNPCAICLGEMSPSAGVALFTAECSHTFHFRCIALNAQHGNLACPLCKAQWRQLPFQSRQLPQQLPQPPPLSRRRIPTFQPHHHAVLTERFDDDDFLAPQQNVQSAQRPDAATGIEVRSYTEYTAVERRRSREVDVLIHLQVPTLPTTDDDDTSRAPLDLVAVLDVSYSMQGEKLQLLKQAMNFVVECLQPSDRLSIISFSQDARRQLPLRRMTAAGKVDATCAVAALHVVGSTNIADGLILGARVIEERRQRNPVCGVLFLSDGQDNCSFLANGPENISRLPPSITGAGTYRVPVHAFGFGSDHDAALMSSIAEASGGTFSFIEAEGDIQDAFAQCLGGLMSVAVQNLIVEIECADPGVSIVGAIQSGRYASHVEVNHRAGSIDVGDMYTGESRDFILRVNAPIEADSDMTKLLYLSTVHTEPVSGRTVESGQTEVKLERPVELGDNERILCDEVERQRRRYEASEAMVAAQAAADRGQFEEAVSLLENCRRRFFHGRTDDLSVSINAEMREMQERLGNRVSYEHHGRAYVLAGISSHRQQRASARSIIPERHGSEPRRKRNVSFGGSAGGGLVSSPYQTPRMAQMVYQSRARTASEAPSQK